MNPEPGTRNPELSDVCLIGDCRAGMRDLIAAGVRVQTCVTSPPYYGLRDYGHPGQLGLEASFREYVANMVEVFGLVRDLLADDGTLWLNLGDSYAGGGRGGNPTEETSGLEGGQANQRASMIERLAKPQTGFPGNRTLANNAISMGGLAGGDGLKRKDLCGIPWRVAFALQEDGWYLRQDIIWAKPNPMPESITDRCTKSHEYLFLLAKRERYYFDAAAISEPLAEASIERLSQPTLKQQRGGERVPGKTNGPMKAVGEIGRRNKRSVWIIATQPYSEAHFATFPSALVEPCILAGSRPGDLVLDPFFGSGTTGEVATRLGRHYLGIELNPEYEDLQRQRIQQIGMPL